MSVMPRLETFVSIAYECEMSSFETYASKISRPETSSYSDIWVRMSRCEKSCGEPPRTIIARSETSTCLKYMYNAKFPGFKHSRCLCCDNGF